MRYLFVFLFFAVCINLSFQWGDEPKEKISAFNFALKGGNIMSPDFIGNIAILANGTTLK